MTTDTNQGGELDSSSATSSNAATRQLSNVEQPSTAQVQSTAVQPKVPEAVRIERRWFGYILMSAAVLLVVVTTAASLCSLATAARPTTVDAYEYVRISARAVVTVAFVMFCYGLLQAGERMAIPTEMIKSVQDLRLLLGVKSPVETSAKELRKAVADVGTLATNLVEAATKKS